MKRQSEGSLRGKVVLITGASRGMGKQAALGFARRGADVVIAARTVAADGSLPGSLGETVKEIEQFGGCVLAVQTELVDIRVRDHGLDNAAAVPMAVPARMMIYFGACEDPGEYSGRIFFAERELAALGIEPVI